MRGYKPFTKHFKCGDYQFKENKIFTLDNFKPLGVDENGFHFSENLENVFQWYSRHSNFIICEVEALGDVISVYNNRYTNILKVGKKIIDFGNFEDIIKYIDKFHKRSWNWISRHEDLPERFIENNAHRMEWGDLDLYRIRAKKARKGRR